MDGGANILSGGSHNFSTLYHMISAEPMIEVGRLYNHLSTKDHAGKRP